MPQVEKPTVKVTLNDLYLYDQFHRFGPMAAGKFAREKFKRFYAGKPETADAVFDAIKASHGVIVVYSAANATNFQVLHHFGLMSDNAYKAASRIFTCNGKTSTHKGKLMAYALLPKYADDGPGSSMGFNRDASIERIIRCIEEGRRNTAHADIGLPYEAFNLPQDGVQKLIQLKSKIAAAKRQLPTQESVAKIGMTDQMLKTWVEAGINIGIPANLVEENLSAKARAQLKRAQKPQPPAARAA